MKKGNYSAFPVTAFDHDGMLTTNEEEFLGLTKREYIAIELLKSMVGVNSLLTYEMKIEKSIEMADELIEKLNQQS